MGPEGSYLFIAIIEDNFGNNLLVLLILALKLLRRKVLQPPN